MKTIRSFTTPEGIKISYVAITPVLAKELLANNTKNRNIRTRLVNQYSSDLAKLDWPFTGDAIRVAKDGTLLDGQHRLEAICQSGKSMTTLVIENLDSTTQRYMDGGAKRSAADQLHLEGIANASICAAVSRMVIRWESWRENKIDVSVSNAEIIEHVMANLEVVTRAGLTAHSIADQIPGASRQGLGAAYYRAVEVTQDPFKVANFFTRLHHGENLTLGDPVFALRNSLIRGDYDNLTQMWMTVRAWNAEQKDESLQKYVYLPRVGISSKTFPDMLPLPVEETLTELDEQTAEILQQLREKM